MSFDSLNQKITEYKSYKIVADYIVENDIEITEFFDSLECLNEEEGFFTGAGKKIDSWSQKLKDMWNKFRGRPYNVESVVDLLQKAADYLNNDENLRHSYRKEIEVLSKIIQRVKSKENVPLRGSQDDSEKIRLKVPRYSKDGKPLSGSDDVITQSRAGTTNIKVGPGSERTRNMRDSGVGYSSSDVFISDNLGTSNFQTTYSV